MSSGKTEWSDVQPAAFPASDSYLYVNQDPGHKFLYLMYDLPVRTAPLAPAESVHVNFDTIETVSGNPALIVYDVYIYGNGQMQVLQQGKPTPPGSIIGGLGFGVSPNSSTQHVMAELQVPLAAGLPPSTYSPDPLFWGASLPPTPPPPNPCPTQPGKDFNDCVKKLANQNALLLYAEAAALATAAYICTTATLLACAPAETPLFLGSVAIGLLAALDSYIAGDPAGIILTIPPDPNYTVLATPATYSFSIPTTGLSSQEAAALTAWFAQVKQIVALQQAAITSIAREEGANAGWCHSLGHNPVSSSSKIQRSSWRAFNWPATTSRQSSGRLVAAEPQFTLAPSDISNHCCPVKSRTESVGWGFR
jgi:hypothetical protein